MTVPSAENVGPAGNGRGNDGVVVRISLNHVKAARCWRGDDYGRSLKTGDVTVNGLVVHTVKDADPSIPEHAGKLGREEF